MDKSYFKEKIITKESIRFLKDLVHSEAEPNSKIINNKDEEFYESLTAVGRELKSSAESDELQPVSSNESSGINVAGNLTCFKCNEIVEYNVNLSTSVVKRLYNQHKTFCGLTTGTSELKPHKSWCV